VRINKEREEEKRNAGEKRKMQIQERRKESRKFHVTSFKMQIGKNSYDHEVVSRLRRHFGWSDERCFLIILIGVRLCPLGTAATIGLLYEPRMIDDDDCGAVGGMKIGRGNRSTRSKPAPAPLCPP
jgi:hypothetical protein